jgi:hypothetical protein
MIKPMVVEGMPIEAYHAPDSAWVSSTFLRTLLDKSPMHAMYEKTVKKDHSRARELGSLIHTLVLEPEEVEARYGVYDGDFRTKEAKAMKADFESRGITVVKSDVMAQAESCRDALKSHLQYNKLFGEGKAEVSLFAAVNSVLVKSRPDFWNTNKGWMIDLKTSVDASPKVIGRKITDLGYHLQACLALRVYEAVFEKPANAYLWVFVEPEAPHGITIAEMNKEMKQLGDAVLDKALALYEKCLETGKYQGYDPNVLKVSPSPWDWNKVDEV